MAKGFNKTQLKIVNSRLQALANLPDTHVPKVLKKVSEEIAKDVQAAAPVVSGNLRRSVYQKSSDDRAKVWVDTTLTETRKSSRNFNYGHTVEHGRAGRYKTTPYFYDVAMRNLGKLVTFINNAVRDAAIKGK